MATVYALWHGGSSYAQGQVSAWGETPSDVETFPSIRAAGAALRSRADNGYWERQDFTYADGRASSSLTPCADQGASMTVWRYDPRDEPDPYPDRMLTLGPRGGVKVERA